MILGDQNVQRDRCSYVGRPTKIGTGELTFASISLIQLVLLFSQTFYNVVLNCQSKRSFKISVRNLANVARLSDRVNEEIRPRVSREGSKGSFYQKSPVNDFSFLGRR